MGHTPAFRGMPYSRPRRSTRNPRTYSAKEPPALTSKASSRTRAEQDLGLAQQPCASPCPRERAEGRRVERATRRSAPPPASHRGRRARKCGWPTSNEGVEDARRARAAKFPRRELLGHRSASPRISQSYGPEPHRPGGPSRRFRAVDAEHRARDGDRPDAAAFGRGAAAGRGARGGASGSIANPGESPHLASGRGRGAHGGVTGLGAWTRSPLGVDEDGLADRRAGEAARVVTVDDLAHAARPSATSASCDRPAARG